MTMPQEHADLAVRLLNIECSLLDEDENATLREAAYLLDTLCTQLSEAQDALQAAQRLFKEALPKFNWGASFLDANAIRLLNEVPAKIDVAIATHLQTLAVTNQPKVSNES